MKIIRTDSAHVGFVSLVHQLDSYLAVVDGADHAFYDQYNGIDILHHVVVITVEDKPVACGAIKEYAAYVAEVKRMFTLPEKRGQGYARLVLSELEKWAQELGYTSCILETGRRMSDAVSLYQKAGYDEIPNYGQYVGVDNSICFEKNISLNITADN